MMKISNFFMVIMVVVACHYQTIQANAECTEHVLCGSISKFYCAHDFVKTFCPVTCNACSEVSTTISTTTTTAEVTKTSTEKPSTTTKSTTTSTEKTTATTKSTTTSTEKPTTTTKPSTTSTEKPTTTTKSTTTSTEKPTTTTKSTTTSTEKPTTTTKSTTTSTKKPTTTTTSTTTSTKRSTTTTEDVTTSTENPTTATKSTTTISSYIPGDKEPWCNLVRYNTNQHCEKYKAECPYTCREDKQIVLNDECKNLPEDIENYNCAERNCSHTDLNQRYRIHKYCSKTCCKRKEFYGNLVLPVTTPSVSPVTHVTTKQTTFPPIPTAETTTTETTTTTSQSTTTTLGTKVTTTPEDTTTGSSSTTTPSIETTKSAILTGDLSSWCNIVRNNKTEHCKRYDHECPYTCRTDTSIVLSDECSSLADLAEYNCKDRSCTNSLDLVQRHRVHKYCSKTCCQRKQFYVSLEM